MTGSIHKVGASLQNAPSCNGWTFWHVVEHGSLTPLDTLRQRHLQAFGGSSVCPEPCKVGRQAFLLILLQAPFD